MAEPSAVANVALQFQAGQPIGASEWLTIDQEMISRFADASLDPDPMHMDPEWAAANSPFGKTIAFGFQTLSLLTHMLHEATGTVATQAPDSGHYLNYGFDRMRLVSPVEVGSRIRGHFATVDEHLDNQGRHRVKIDVRVEIEGRDRPALVGEWLTIWVPPRAA